MRWSRLKCNGSERCTLMMHSLRFTRTIDNHFHSSLGIRPRLVLASYLSYTDLPWQQSHRVCVRTSVCSTRCGPYKVAHVTSTANNATIAGNDDDEEIDEANEAFVVFDFYAPFVLCTVSSRNRADHQETRCHIMRPKNAPSPPPCSETECANPGCRLWSHCDMKTLGMIFCQMVMIGTFRRRTLRAHRNSRTVK